jgi:hypothetical protein
LVHNFHNSLFLTCCTSSFSASTNGTNEPRSIMYAPAGKL